MFTNKEDERKFEDVVRSIARSEEDVDKLLAAARLTRHEGPDRRMTGDQKAELLGGLIFALTFLGFIFLVTHILSYIIPQ